MPKRSPRFLTIPVDDSPGLVERIDALAKADRRSRSSWLLKLLEEVTAPGPQELPEERSAA
jgi:predicted transcriptional regulator